MNDISIETGSLGPLYQSSCGTNPAPDAHHHDYRIKFADSTQRRLFPVTAITPISLTSVIQILEAKRVDAFKQQQQNNNNNNYNYNNNNNNGSSGGSGGHFAPTSSINTAFVDPRLRQKHAEIAAGVGAAGTITAAADEAAVAQLQEKTRAYALAIVDGCASDVDYARLQSTRVRKTANAEEAIAAQLLTSSSAGSTGHLVASQLASTQQGGGGGASSSSSSSSLLLAQLQLRFGPDVNLLGMEEGKLSMLSSMGMLSPQEKNIIMNQQRIAQLEAGGGVDVGTDLSIFSGLANPLNPSSLRTMLKPFEVCMLATLMPATLEEALAYIPTLAAYEPMAIEAVLKGLRQGL